MGLENSVCRGYRETCPITDGCGVCPTNAVTIARAWIKRSKDGQTISVPFRGRTFNVRHVTENAVFAFTTRKAGGGIGIARGFELYPGDTLPDQRPAIMRPDIVSGHLHLQMAFYRGDVEAWPDDLTWSFKIEDPNDLVSDLLWLGRQPWWMGTMVSDVKHVTEFVKRNAKTDKSIFACFLVPCRDTLTFSFVTYAEGELSDCPATLLGAPELTPNFPSLKDLTEHFKDYEFIAGARPGLADLGYELELVPPVDFLEVEPLNPQLCPARWRGKLDCYCQDFPRLACSYATDKTTPVWCVEI